MNDPPDIDLIPNADKLVPERPNKRQRSSVARQVSRLQATKVLVSLSRIPQLIAERLGM
jgi:hypothetical protein